MNPTIIVATHREAWMPTDSLYLPVHVGAATSPLTLPYQRDDEGENISDRNGRYSELTGLYWAWKNVDAEAIGLAHYRRHFAGSGENGILTSSEASELLQKAPIIVPSKRRYYIESVASHYGHTFDSNHLEVLRAVIAGLAPEYVPAYERVLASRSAHIFNMMVMRRDLLDEYCAWLFPILFAAEERLDFSQMSDFEARVMGRLSERLLDVWLLTTGHPYTECPFTYLEKVNWLKKGSGFLAAKFLGRKYTRSF